MKTLFTDRGDNVELASVLTVLAFLAFVYFSYHEYIEMLGDFDPAGWGMGLGSIIAGGGAGKFMGNRGDYGSAVARHPAKKTTEEYDQ